MLRHTLILSGFSMAIVLGPSAAPANEKQVVEATVVRTFGELMSQPLLILRDGTQVRVGLEARQVPQDSGFLVYAVMHRTNWPTSGEHPLGPLHVEISRDGPKDREVKLLSVVERAHSGRKGGSPFFFAATVFVRSAGRYELAFRDAEGALVARAFVSATEEKVQPWLTFAHHERESGQRDNLGEVIRRLEPEQSNQATPAALKALAWRRALPRCDGSEPFELPRDPVNGIAAKEPLPRWFFAREPRLELTAAPASLDLASLIDLDFHRPEGHLLFRIWINQTPFHDTALKAQDLEEASSERKEGISISKRLHIDLDLNFARFGARKGDRVAVQLLYCPDGTHQVRHEREGKRGESKKEARDVARQRLPLLSPKVEFTVP